MNDERNQHPEFSVVIPAFNRADSVVAAIESCLAQRDVDSIEVVVVDDCSSDGTVQVVESLQDPRVLLVGHDRNLGGAAARNSGIDAARGTYIAFLDSDDLWDENKLATQAALIKAQPNPIQVVCHCRIRARSADLEEVLPHRAVYDGEAVAEYLFVQGGHIQTSTLLMSAELARKTRFDASLRKHQDYDFCLRLDQNGARFVMAEQPLVTWFHDDRPDRITHRYGAEASEHFLRTRHQVMGGAASDAFWVNQIFLKQLGSTPWRALRSFVGAVVSKNLPLSWYLGWLQRGVSRHWGRRWPGPRKTAVGRR